MKTMLAMIISTEETNMVLKYDEIISSIGRETRKFETPLRKIEIPYFSQVYVKDESVNPTGTHKDRMAYEIVKVYRNFLTTKKENELAEDLPSMSLLSSGAAAIAIQTALIEHNLPNLKVLLDEKTNLQILNHLKRLGCEIYTYRFIEKALSGEEILHLTNNDEGIDITSGKAFDPSKEFYRSLVEEISDLDFDYVFMPFGSGNLYETFINLSKEKKIAWLKKCNFVGGEIDSYLSIANQLYSPFRPFTDYSKQWMKMFQLQGYCGFHSGIYKVTEENILEAISLFKLNNVNANPEGCVGLALLLQLKDKIPNDKKILVINTGKLKLNLTQSITLESQCSPYIHSS